MLLRMRSSSKCVMQHDWFHPLTTAARRSAVLTVMVGKCCCCFLQALTTKEKIAHMKASMPANVAKAMGRLSSGLYIVAAQQENARR